MASVGTWFRTMLHQEPIIMWSCIIGAIGARAQALTLPVYCLEFKEADAPNVATTDSACPAACAGIALPVVVPPIRESFSKPRQVQPPDVKKVSLLIFCSGGLLVHSAPANDTTCCGMCR